jgi:DNA-binding SARP family transcriptional activator
MMPEGGSTTDQSAGGWADWRKVFELLRAGQYEQVAELLGEAEATSQQRGDTGLTQILAAAQRICLTCSQSREEAEWHRQATQEAAQREDELGQQLQAILDLVSGYESLNAEQQERGAPPVLPAKQSLAERALPEAPRHPSLWKRIQSLFGQESNLHHHQEHEMSIKSPEVPFGPRTEKEKVDAPVSSTLAVYCLGPFRVYQNDQPITDWNSLKSKSIFKYLVTNRETPIGKEILMDVFWTDADPDAARRNLHQAVYSLRQILRRDQSDFQHIRFQDDCYLLNPEMDVWLDFKEFEKHAQAGQRFEAAGRFEEAMAEYGVAEGLYQGDFLEEDLYEDWPRVQRDHMRSTYLDIVDRLSEYYEGRREYTTAIALCQKVLAQDNCYEEAHLRLMQCYLGQGQRHLAIRQYQTCVQALNEELDLTPSEETVALYRHITTA